ncbi:SURF1 family protein [Nocardioides speluncae]|uniref:SURF1 family cytochrome oxidase biogenesis protein n=1 Tax=Nocardioides speluncae TaxID=2670337 RepID=UPI000D69DD54|nr:SURF1 family protein [Nocardioides speluncae]
MSSLRLFLSRRWVLFAITVALLAWLAWRLGEWQFHRLEDRKERNAIIERNTSGPPVPVAEALAVDDPVEKDEEWQRVTATGSYDTANTVIIRYRTRDGAPGVDVVVPFTTTDGPALLVDRGWFGTDERNLGPDDVPAPPAGEVIVTGWARTDGTGDSTAVHDQSARAISSERIGDALDLTVYGGFVDLESETPEADEPLERAELPELNNGPHFFYGLQWWFFGALAIFGFCYLAYDEWRKLRSERAQHATVDRDHHPADER